MDVLVGQTPVRLDKDDLLKQGGEALIFKHGLRYVIKIYHTPTQARAKKLTDFWASNFQLSTNVVAPLEPVYDVKSGRKRLIGFSMRRLRDGFEAIDKLGIRRFCADRGLTTKDVVKAFIDAHDDLSQFHFQGLIVGDLSNNNTVYYPDRHEVAWLDVDSMQFGIYPCMVGTEQYLSPDLYGVDLSLGPSFKEKHDWYSYVVLLFIGLFKAHPFKGFHPKWKSLTSCAQHGATILDPDVRYPKVALPPDVVTDELKDILMRYLKRKEGQTFPVDELREYGEILIECKYCNLWYPARLKNCPGCAQKTTLDAQLAKGVLGYEHESLIVTQGHIVYVQVINDTVYCLADESGQTVLYEKTKGQTTKRLSLFATTHGSAYGIFKGMLVICPNPADQKPKLFVIDVGASQPRPVFETTTEQIAGGRAVFGASSRYIYRIAGTVIVRGELYGDTLANREVAQALPGQTWFTVCENPPKDKELLFGYLRVFEDLQWFVILGDEKTKQFHRHDVPLPNLRRGEVISEISVRFHESKVLALRKTRYRGVDFIRVETVDAQTGQVLDSRIEKVTDAAVYENVRGKAYGNGILMHPSDDGIVREIVSSGIRETLARTSQYLQSDSSLFAFGSNLAIVTGNQILELKMGKGGK